MRRCAAPHAPLPRNGMASTRHKRRPQRMNLLVLLVQLPCHPALQLTNKTNPLPLLQLELLTQPEVVVDGRL